MLSKIVKICITSTNILFTYIEAERIQIHAKEK